MAVSEERVIRGFPAIQPTAVGVAGTTVGIPMIESGRLRSVYAKLVSGTGVNFTLTIYDKEITPGDNNIVFQYDTAGDTDPTLIDDNVEIVFRAEAIGENRLWVKVVPNAGADNVFFIQLKALAGVT